MNDEKILAIWRNKDGELRGITYTSFIKPYEKEIKEKGFAYMIIKDCLIEVYY